MIKIITINVTIPARIFILLELRLDLDVVVYPYGSLGVLPL